MEVLANELARFLQSMACEHRLSKVLRCAICVLVTKCRELFIDLDLELVNGLDLRLYHERMQQRSA